MSLVMNIIYSRLTALSLPAPPVGGFGKGRRSDAKVALYFKVFD
jgi:hypothetical protein